MTIRLDPLTAAVLAAERLQRFHAEAEAARRADLTLQGRPSQASALRLAALLRRVASRAARRWPWPHIRLRLETAAP